MRYFVLQGIDDQLDMPLFETRIAVDDIERLRAILGSCASDDTELAGTYTLDEEEIAQINLAFGSAFVSHGRDTLLEPWHTIRSAPYLIHTGFELPLMLEERKPMAVFSDAYPVEWLDRVVQRFEPYVDDGRITKRVHDEPFSLRVASRAQSRFAFLRTIYFFVPGEGWRVDAHITLRSNGSWDDMLERTEGSLLGYSDEQNDWWMAFRRDRFLNRQAEPGRSGD